jgi:hypothetical protein
MKTDEKNSYFAKKNRESYDRRKEHILRRKIIKRIEKDLPISIESVNDPVRNWSNEEKTRLLEYIEKHKNSKLKYRNEMGYQISSVMDVNQHDVKFINENLQNDTNISNSHLKSKLPQSALQHRVDDDSKGFYQLYKEDKSSEGYNYTINQTKDKLLTINQFSDMITFLIEQKIHFLKNKNSKIQKDLNYNSYISRMRAILSIICTDNIVDIYRNPEFFHNSLVLSHLSISSIKDYASLPLTIYKLSQYYSPFSFLQKSIHSTQIEKFRGYVKQGILFSKQNETERLMTKDYYLWDDIREVPKLIENHYNKRQNDIDLLRDMVISSFYVKEVVLRDNLGSVIIGNGYPNSSLNHENYLDLQNGILYLRDFKTSSSLNYTDFKLKIFPDTMEWVKLYLDEMKKTLGGIYPKYLITKRDGTPYKYGKLSGYIKKLMKKYTGAIDFTINDFRHSVATFHRNSPLPIKEHLAFMLHHSFQQHIYYERHSNRSIRLPVIEHHHTTTTTTDLNVDPFLNKRIYSIHYHNNIMVVSTGTVKKNENYNKLIVDKKDHRSKEYKIDLIDIDPTKKPIHTNLPDYPENNHVLM